MLDWLSGNWINVVLIAGIAVVVVLIVCGMVRNRKQGKAPCGCNCAECALHGACCSAQKK